MAESWLTGVHCFSSILYEGKIAQTDEYFYVLTLVKTKIIIKNIRACRMRVIVSPKSGDAMDYARPSSASIYACAEISCVQPTSYISFGISFKLCKWLAVAEI